MSTELPGKMTYMDPGLVRSENDGIASSAIAYKENNYTHYFDIKGHRSPFTGEISFTLFAPGSLGRLCCECESPKCVAVCSAAFDLAKSRISQLLVVDGAKYKCKCKCKIVHK